LALPFLWVSGIKEAYKGLLNGDILMGVNGLIEKLYQKNLFVFLLAQAFFL